jgi:DNA-binding response OmpR family regulator
VLLRATGIIFRAPKWLLRRDEDVGGTNSEAHVPAPEETALCSVEAANSGPGNRQMRILLIDDSRLIRFANEKALTKAGYEVIGVGNGEQGLHVARESHPDLILLDMMLPKVAGLEVLRTLKRDARTRHIPIVVLTGLSQANEGKLVEEGAVGFVQKSDDILENESKKLVSTVQAILSRVEGHPSESLN